MDRTMLRDDQWARIEQLLPGKRSDPGRTAKDNRRFVEAVLDHAHRQSMARFAGRARPLAPHRMCASRWREKGVWERMATALQGDADLHLFIDSTIVRAHPHSAGAQKSRPTGNRPFAGGLMTQLHVAVDALGNPLRVILSAGQVADIEQAAAPIQINPPIVAADKGATTRMPLSKQLPRRAAVQSSRHVPIDSPTQGCSTGISTRAAI